MNYDFSQRRLDHLVPAPPHPRGRAPHAADEAPHPAAPVAQRHIRPRAVTGRPGARRHVATAARRPTRRSPVGLLDVDPVPTGHLDQPVTTINRLDGGGAERGRPWPGLTATASLDFRLDRPMPRPVHWPHLAARCARSTWPPPGMTCWPTAGSICRCRPQRRQTKTAFRALRQSGHRRRRDGRLRDGQLRQCLVPRRSAHGPPVVRHLLGNHREAAQGPLPVARPCLSAGTRAAVDGFRRPARHRLPPPLQKGIKTSPTSSGSALGSPTGTAPRCRTGGRSDGRRSTRRPGLLVPQPASTAPASGPQSRAGTSGTAGPRPSLNGCQAQQAHTTSRDKANRDTLKKKRLKARPRAGRAGRRHRDHADLRPR